MSFSAITLEMSLKPFFATDDESVRAVCARLFEQWRPLIKDRKTVSVLLWSSDGSEILDYAGDFDEPFEWAYFWGTANLPFWKEGEGERVSLHRKKRLYTEHPAKMTYGTLRRIVSLIRQEGQKALGGAAIRVGATFDLGPEFAISSFKYERHPEIIGNSSFNDGLGFVDGTALLHADSRRYAAYPDGIPEGEPFASFFGAQANAFLTDLGFDYIWLSNGLGFSADPWSSTGKVFDGKTFFPEKLRAIREKVFDFWRLFRRACPAFPVETRGTNNTAGMDYATDGVPLCEIYRGGFGLLPPPNSPWAAIDDNYGLELMGHLTRSAELPDGRFPFRYYLHDPWWMNSPWRDRYDGAAGDIYLPMSLSRVDESGNTRAPDVLSILSIDNSLGKMPDDCVNEPLPNLLKAEKDAADEPAPVVLVYPVREFTSAESEADLSEMYDGDRFVVDNINNGFPLATVVSADLFLRHDLSLYRKSILLSPVPHDEAVLRRLAAFCAEGGHVILYGSPDRLADARRFVPDAALADLRGGNSVLREKLALFGYEIGFCAPEDGIKVPTLTVSRSDNALFFSVYSNNTTVETRLRFPLGAPLLTGIDTILKNGSAVYRFARCEHRECRVFVDQREDGVICSREANPTAAAFDRRLFFSGLRDATVRVFPEKARADRILAIGGAKWNYDLNDDDAQGAEIPFRLVRDDKNGDHFAAEHVTGTLSVYFHRIS